MRAAEEHLVLRGVCAADAEALARLSRESFSEYDSDAERRGEALATRPNCFSRVLEFKGDVIGFAVLSQRDGQAWLDAIAVAPQHRGRGHGRTLLKSMEREARRCGLRSLGLATADSNLGALDLFLRQGFEIQQRKARYYERGQHAVLMTKAL